VLLSGITDEVAGLYTTVSITTVFETIQNGATYPHSAPLSGGCIVSIPVSKPFVSILGRGTLYRNETLRGPRRG
jgi:hypothetical protein